MRLLSRISPCLAIAAVLSSCDRVKQGLLTVVKEGATKASQTLSGRVPVQPLGQDSIQPFIETTEHVAVVVYFSNNCGACKILDPVLQRVLADAKGPVMLGSVDVDSQHELAKESDVLGLPDVRMYINGAQVDRFVGAEDEQMIRQKLDAQVAVLKSGKLPPRPPKPADDDELPQKLLTQPMSKDWMPPGMERH